MINRACGNEGMIDQCSGINRGIYGREYVGGSVRVGRNVVAIAGFKKEGKKQCGKDG